MKALRPTTVTLGLILALMTPALAQRATLEQMGDFAGTDGYESLHMTSNLGSFKIYPGEGRIEIDFSGTILISNLQGEVVKSPEILQEYSGYNRTVYHGTGKIVVSGKWRAVQWFGTDMKADWYGKGLCRITGEFDRDLKTGEYWYKDPEDKGNWATSMLVITLPERKTGNAPNVIPQKRGGGGN